MLREEDSATQRCCPQPYSCDAGTTEGSSWKDNGRGQESLSHSSVLCVAARCFRSRVEGTLCPGGRTGHWVCPLGNNTAFPRNGFLGGLESEP